jgi:hypothetical protein
MVMAYPGTLTVFFGTETILPSQVKKQPGPFISECHSTPAAKQV